MRQMPTGVRFSLGGHSLVLIDKNRARYSPPIQASHDKLHYVVFAMHISLFELTYRAPRCFTLPNCDTTIPIRKTFSGPASMFRL